MRKTFGLVLFCPMLAAAACGGTTSSTSTTPTGTAGSTSPASSANPSADPAVTAICQKLAPDLRKLGSDVGTLIRSPQSFLAATSDLSHVLSTDLTAVTDSTFKTKANGLATDIADIRTAIQAGHVPSLGDITGLASNAQALVRSCNAHGVTPSAAPSS